MRHLSPLAGAALLTIAVLTIGASYLKFYTERTQNYYKHLYVLQYECQSGRQLPHIQYNAMTYDGTTTNCTEALVFTSILPSLGAIHDMWIASPFYALMFATDWKIQLAYVLLSVVVVVTIIRSCFALRAQQAVLNTFSNSQKTVRSTIDGRARMLVKVPEKKEPMQQLAKRLIEEDLIAEPVFTKMVASHSRMAPQVVGTLRPSTAE